jgi:hypothetical protein
MSHWNYDEIKKVIELWRKILLVTLNFDTRRVSILVLGPISKSFHKNWNKFELRLHNFIPIFMETFAGPKSNSINLWNWTSLWIFRTSTFGCKLENVWITYQFFNEIESRPFETSNNATWRKGRWTGGGNHVLTVGYRVFLGGDPQTKCLDGDRQRTVWCLEQHELRCLRNGRTEYALTVSYRRRGKLGCRANSLPFCGAHENSHVSS